MRITVTLFTAVAASALTLFALSGCTVTDSPSSSDAVSSEGNLSVDAASSLAGMTDDFSSSISSRVNMTSTFTLDGTSTLVTQILGGQQADILISADASSFDKLTEGGLVDGAPVPLATNHLVLAVPAGNPSAINSLDDVDQPGLRVVLCEATVPCGKLAATVIAAYNLFFTPMTETPNVSAAVKLLTSGEADAGFVYATDVQASDGKLIAVNDKRLAHSSATVTGIVIADSNHREQARHMLEYWASPNFVPLWQSRGFTSLAR